jgi:transposase
LGAISGNRFKNCELSPFQRGIIIGKHSTVLTAFKIAKELKLDPGTVRYTIAKNPERYDGRTKGRNGRPRQYTDAEERLVLRHVRLNPKDTYTEVLRACGVKFKTSTLKKILRLAGISNWRAKKRPFLTKIHAAKRLAWCLARRHWNKETWGMVVWSDECSVERGRGKKTEWVFRTPPQKWNPEMIQTYDAHKNMKVMVWGAFWDHGRSNLYIVWTGILSRRSMGTPPTPTLRC